MLESPSRTPRRSLITCWMIVPRDAHVAAERVARRGVILRGADEVLAMALALDAQLAGALVLDEHAHVLGLREQIEQRLGDLLEQRLRVVRRRGGVEHLGERVQLALHQPDGALIDDADQPRADQRDAAGARVLAAADQLRVATDIDQGDAVALAGARLRGHADGLDLDPVVRDRDLVVVLDRRGLLEPHTVDVRAVVGAEILERPAFAVLPQPRVLPRHAHVGHEDLAVGSAADHVLTLTELVSPTGDRAGQEHERGHDRF